VGLAKPAIRFKTVDLPLPEGPSRQTNSPAVTCSETSRRISTVVPRASTLRDTPSRARLVPARAESGVFRGTVDATDATPEEGGLQPFAEANTTTL
jgi:hypothetical protein